MITESIHSKLCSYPTRLTWNERSDLKHLQKLYSASRASLSSYTESSVLIPDSLRRHEADNLQCSLSRLDESLSAGAFLFSSVANTTALTYFRSPVRKMRRGKMFFFGAANHDG